jgi:hypothetical protein
LLTRSAWLGRIGELASSSGLPVTRAATPRSHGGQSHTVDLSKSVSSTQPAVIPPIGQSPA